MWFYLFIDVHLVVELGQQLFQGETDVIAVIFLIAVGDYGGYDAGAHQANVHGQLLQNIDHLLMCLPNERDPIHLPGRQCFLRQIFLWLSHS